MRKLLTSTVLFVCFGYFAFAQQTISGKVQGEGQALGLEGVNIKLGSSILATTDFEGEFTITTPEQNSTITFSFKGYQDLEVVYTGQTSLNVTMQKETADQTESNKVSLGYGSVSKEELTSSVAAIESEGLGSQPVVTLEQANQGRATGVFVQNTGGELGANANVRIRGGSSLTASNSPLYVVDGVPLASGSQSNINPNNIASIEVLKDASAASIYGSRAANGVILITTKKGTAGKTRFDVDYQFGISETPKTLDVFSGREHKILVLEFILRQFGFDSDITRENLENWVDSGSNSIQLSSGTLNLPAFYDSLRYDTDWQDEIFRTGYSHRANLSASGGSENLGYFAGVSYLSQDGIQIGNDFDRFNAQLNLNSKFSSKLSANLTTSFARTTNNRLNEDNDLGNPIQAIVLPNSDSFDPTNDYELFVSSLFYNPVTEIEFSDNIQTSNIFIGNLGLNYTLNNNLKLRVESGLDMLDDRYERRQGPETLDGEPTGFSRLTETNVFNYLVNGYLDYNNSFSNSNMSIILGTSYQESTTDINFRSARLNSIDELEALPEGSSSLLNNPIPGGASTFLSYYTRVNYSIENKYLFQVSGRMDGSSRFGPNNRYGFFPAVSAGWNIANESFMQNANAVSFLKLRASYGLIGNTPDADFLYASNYFIVNYGDEDGLRGENLSNPDLKWETTSQIDVGIDYGFISDRISGSLNYYIKDTKDLLFPRPITQISGFSSVIDNVATMTNKGWEFSFSSINVRNGDFTWSTDFNISSNENEITDLGGEQLIAGVSAFLEGEAAGSFYVVNFSGVNTTTGEAEYTYTNDAGNEVVTSDYDEAFENGRSIMGNPNPKFFGGLSNTFSYKTISLSFLFQFVQGVDIYNATGEYFANSGYQAYGQRLDQQDRWYAPGDNAPYPALNPSNVNTFPSSRWLEDGSYIRLNSLTLTYNLPEVTVFNMGLQRFSFFVGGQNLFTITDYKGYDPDVNSIDPGSGTIGENIFKGIDNFTAPQARTFITGIKIGF